MRPMKSKWASCSTAGNLTFNAELLGMDTKLGDYVIVHELLHFSVPNHGKLWKSLMRAHLGDYEKLEQTVEGSRYLTHSWGPGILYKGHGKTLGISQVASSPEGAA